MNAHMIRLDDGIDVYIRPIEAGDVLPLLDMHDRLSTDSLYYRYLRAYRPTFEDIERICNLGGTDGAAFAVVVDSPWQTIIGVAFYVVSETDPTAAEPAFLVEDRFQGQGLGRRLWDLLCRDARARGVRVFTPNVHLANEAMLRIIRTSGLVYETSVAYGTREFYVQLDEQPASVYAVQHAGY